VAELRLHGLDAGALGDQQRRAGVPQVVQPQSPGQPGRTDRRLEEIRDPGVRAQRAAQRRGEHQRVRITRAAGEVVLDLINDGRA
jgi:hypothetical protein